MTKGKRGVNGSEAAAGYGRLMLKWLVPVILLGAVLVALPDEAPDKSRPAPAAQPTSDAEETHLLREENGHFYAEAVIAGEPVLMLVDTGASTVALTTEDAARVGVDFSEEDFQPIGTGASGAVRGVRTTLDSVDVDGKEVPAVEAAVVEGLEVSLLGQSYLSRLDAVSMSGDTMVLR